MPYHSLFQLIPGYISLGEIKSASPEADPCVSIVSEPRLRLQIPDASISSICVPIFYHEATQLEDIPKYKLEVRGLWTDFYGFNQYTPKDTFGRFDSYSRSIRVALPQPPPMSEWPEPEFRETYECTISVSLKLKSWRGSKADEVLHSEAVSKVTVARDRGVEEGYPIYYDKGPNWIVLGVDTKRDFDVLLTEAEMTEIAKIEQWRKWARIHESEWAYLETKYGGRGEDI